MKRLFSTFCLLVGASVASYAGVISSANGALLGPNAALIDFESPTTFPAGSFSSLPQFNASAGTTNVGVTISASGAGSGTNTGSQAAITGQFASTFGSGRYLTTYSGPTPAVNTPSNFTRTITLTFATGLSDIIFDYFASETNFHSFAVNGVAQTTLLNQGTSSSANRLGFTVDGTTPVINSISFTFTGTDAGGAGDQVIFDNIRVVAGGTVSSSGSSTPSTSGGGGEIPEPSTYALMGAGLLALGYARRKK
jgi:hypothetical protein